MKTLILTSIIALMTLFGNTVRAEEYPDEYLGLPGDNLNLYAVMKLFQESETLEGFERSLNDENSRINNLDLNGDNYVDYIMVFDYVDGNVHTIVLRVAINEYENQDVAVFTVERFNNGSAQVQLIGDEALYGKNYIVEPIYAENGNETPNPGYIGNTRTNRNVTVLHTTTYEVAAWPLIRYIFLPDYMSWHSSWRWGYYPSYYDPWRPYYWHYYYGYHSRWNSHYNRHYRHWDHYRYQRYRDHYYSGIRVFSPHVTININKGKYKHTYSRPNLRKQGEALYARTNTGRHEINRGRSASVPSSARVKASAADRTSRSAVRSDARRSATTVRDKNAAAGARRSATDVRSRTAVKSTGKTDAVRNRSTTSGARRSPEAVSSRNAERNTGRTSTAVSNSRSNNSARRSADAVSESNARSDTRKLSTTVNNSARRSAPAVSNRSATGRSSSTISNKSATSTRKATPAVRSRSTNSTSRKAAPAVSKKRTISTSRKAAPAVSKKPAVRNTQRSSSAVQRNTTIRRSAPAPSRSSSPARKSSTVKRSSTPSVKSATSRSTSRSSSRSSRPSISNKRSSSSSAKSASSSSRSTSRSGSERSGSRR